MSLKGYLKDVRAEMKHISWPKKDTVIKHTSLVIAIALVIGVGLGMLDSGFSQILARFLGV